MDDRGDVALTRRSVLGLVVALLATGCAPGAMPRGIRPSLGYPYPAEWCFSRTPKSLDILGKVIMQERNPYCRITAPVQCKNHDTSTWPMELTDETTYQLLTQFDYHPRKWPFDGTYTAEISRSMRIPYLIKHTIAKKSKKTIPQVGFEHLLVGFEPKGKADPPSPWEGPDNSCPNDSIGELASFIISNMKPTGQTSFAVSPWQSGQPATVEAGLQLTHWQFRQLMIEVEHVIRIPIATGKDQTSTTPGRIYIGYEGGGAY